MATMAAQSAYLPSIKCSDCSREIDISQMGEHSCSQAPSAPQQPMDRFNNAFSSMKSNKLVPAPFRSKPIPASIDPSAANRPFRQPSPLTGRKSPFRLPLRSATSPMPPRSPSPDLPLAQECAFPPFPITQGPAPASTNAQRKAPERAQTEGSAHHIPQSATFNRPFNWERKATGSVSTSVSRSSSPTSTRSGQQRPSTSGSDSTRKNSFSGIRPKHDYFSDAPALPPVPSFSEITEQPSPASLNGVRLPFAAFPSEESVPQLHRSNMTPSPQPLEQQSQRPVGHFRKQSVSAANRPLDEIGSVKVGHLRQPSISAANRPLDEIGSVKTHRRCASRGASPTKLETGWGTERSRSATGERTDRRIYDAPPVPGLSPMQFGEAFKPRSASATGTRCERKPFESLSSYNSSNSHGFEASGNPYHTPTESNSSNGSASLSPGSRSSPPTSASSFGTIRKESGGVELPRFGDFTMPANMPAAPVFEESPVFPEESTFDMPPPAPATQNPPQTRRRPAKSFSRPNYAKPADVAPPLESPLDPVMQHGHTFPQSTNDSPPSPQPPYSAPFFQSSSKALEPPPSPAFIPYKKALPHPPRRRATTGTKGSCRGCGELIKGKSVSSADGRLTGRWHKQCFVCKTCREPFQTTDFYVLENNPYCSRHYHQLNQTLCTNCDRGIEGQYVETDRMQKYHPHCFTCRDCHLILRDNYFEEASGKILCEQHAFRSDLLGPGGRRFPEKRSTRLMMMM